MFKAFATVNRSAVLRRTAALGAAPALAALAALAADASIPDASGVIQGCYQRISGTLRVIDDAVATCDANETPLTWSQRGVPGPAGAPGAQRPPGPAGPPGSPAARLLTTAAGAGFTTIPCSKDNEAGPVHSVAFTKSAGNVTQVQQKRPAVHPPAVPYLDPTPNPYAATGSYSERR